MTLILHFVSTYIPIISIYKVYLPILQSVNEIYIQKFVRLVDVSDVVDTNDVIFDSYDVITN